MKTSYFTRAAIRINDLMNTYGERADKAFDNNNDVETERLNGIVTGLDIALRIFEEEKLKESEEE